MKTKQIILSQAITALLLTSTSLAVLSQTENATTTSQVEARTSQPDARASRREARRQRREERRQRRNQERPVINEAPEVIVSAESMMLDIEPSAPLNMIDVIGAQVNRAINGPALSSPPVQQGPIRFGVQTPVEEEVPDSIGSLEPAPNGPGCDITPASAAVGADVAETYFGPPPSSVNPSLVGPLELLTAGDIDRSNLTVELPLYRGQMQDGRNVFYIVTDTTDQGNAEGLGINFSAKLAFADIGRAVRDATLLRNGLLVFEKGTVDFSPEREVEAGGEGEAAFPPSVANPGAIGDIDYTPLVKISNAGGHIYNMPVIAFDVTAEQINAPNGDVDYSLVHDRVAAIDIFENPVEGSTGTVTLNLVPGFSFGKPILYLTMEASLFGTAAVEANTFAPGLQDVSFGFDDSLFGPAERLFTVTNGATGCENPQRQGQSAALSDGETPFNILGGIPTVATDYSPLWDVNVAEWTQTSIESGFRSRLIDEFQFLTFVQNGFLVGPGGGDFGSAGLIVNCPIVFRFL